MAKTIERILYYAKELKLPYLQYNIEAEIEESSMQKINKLDFLLHLLEKEYELRLENSKYNRIRIAKFPQKKYIEDLQVEYLPEDAQLKLEKLLTLEFINQKQNLILAGNPGTGKSHLAIGLGIKACNEGYKVLFSTVTNLINRLKEHRSQRSLLQLERQFEKYDLIVLDELGYISFDKEGGELLFSLLSIRVERNSTIITTNLSFERWNEIFNDPVMTAAMVDRLTHKSFMINMNGSSYRLKETTDMLNSSTPK